MKLGRYSRQMLFRAIGEHGQKLIQESSVLIIGCGALGTVSSNHLVRAGVGNVKIVDRDYVELDNLQRQILFDESDVIKRLPKAVAATNKLREVNSDIQIEHEILDVNPRNIEQLLEHVDLVIDATDNIETRYLINDACIKNGIPWIYAGVIGSGGMTMSILPDKSACFRCFVKKPPAPGALPTCDMMGVLSGAVGVIASIQATEALKILTRQPNIGSNLIYTDIWSGEFGRVPIEQHSDCPTCIQKKFDFLRGTTMSETFSLCGRDAVQISAFDCPGLDLEGLKMRLMNVGAVDFNGFFLSFKIDKYELIVFPEGRTIVKGTTDESIARSLYSRYVGI